MSDDRDIKARSRKWLLTINNPQDNGYTHEFIKSQLGKIKSLDYFCMCDEIGTKSQVYHTHLFVYRQDAMRFNQIKKLFPVAHIDYCRGTAQENKDYCLKQGKYLGSRKEETNLKDTFEESGDMPVERQGRRNDLIDLYDMVKAGMTNFEILESNPEYLMNLDKIDSCRQVVNSEKYRREFRKLEVEYYCGKTGKGKTRSIMERWGYENVYRVTDYKHPFDMYVDQPVIVFEEFHSSLKIQDMLNYLDGYPLLLPSRYNNKVACYTTVYIVSNLKLEEQYRSVQREYWDTWEAFLRRINKVKLYRENDVKEYENVADYIRRKYEFDNEISEDCPFTDKVKTDDYKQETMNLN